MTQERRYDSLTVRVEVPGGDQPIVYKLGPASMKVHVINSLTEGGQVERADPALELGGVILDVKKEEPKPAMAVGPANSMYDVQQRWHDCTGCELCEKRRQVVFGSGNDVDPKILIIGEAPGKDEDVQGIPFIGPTGQYLRRTLARVGINPDQDCYITNSVVCFPTPDGERIGKATASQLLACRPRLNEQFEFLARAGSLRAILLVGKYAYIQFFKRAEMEAGQYDDPKAMNALKLGAVLGWYPNSLPWGPIKVMTVYHPSYLQRQKATEASPLFVDWKRDLEALKDWALNQNYWDPRPLK